METVNNTTPSTLIDAANRIANNSRSRTRPSVETNQTPQGECMITIVVTHDIGRRSTNDVCIPNLSVSGRHARIVLSDGEVWVEDLNSTNGTYINSRLISRQMLNDNDELIVGKTRVRFHRTAAAAQADVVVQAPTPITTAEPLDAPTQLKDVGKPRVQVANPVEAPAQIPTGLPAAVASSTPSESESMFESLADDLAESAPAKRAESVAVNAAPPPVAPAEAKSTTDESALSLSERAKLALSRQGNPRPTLAAVNGASGAVAAAAVNNASAPAVTPPADIAPKSQPAEAEQSGAVIEIKNGAKSGQVLPIDKPVTTLGRPGIQIAAIMRKPDGYFLMHIESDDSVDRPTLNNDAIGDEPMLLHTGDALNVAGIDVEFSLS